MRGVKEGRKKSGLRGPLGELDKEVRLSMGCSVSRHQREQCCD